MGDLIRVPMPAMSEERRKEMTKLVRTKAKRQDRHAQPAPRRQRAVKKLVKDKLASEDDQKRAEADIQKVTDKHIAESTSWSPARNRRSWRSDGPPRSGLSCPWPTSTTVPAPHRHRHGRQRPLGDRRFLPRVAGHKQGVDALRPACAPAASAASKVLTVFAFSSENWNRRRGSVRPDGTAGPVAGARSAAA
jgi:hypothetical protein